MRLPRPTTRRLMAMVAIVALVSWAGLELSQLRFESQQLIFASVERRFVSRLQALLLVAAAVTAVLAITTLRRRRATYLSLAMDHARSERALWQALAKERKGYDLKADIITYHNRMKQKYLRAAERPWLSVSRDPPPPK